MQKAVLFFKSKVKLENKKFCGSFLSWIFAVIMLNKFFDKRFRGFNLYVYKARGTERRIYVEISIISKFT